MNRRTFLYGGLASMPGRSDAAGLLATPDQVAGRKKLRVGIIGCGRMGQYFAEVYRRLPDTELAAIAEWNDDRRKAVGERFGVKALYRDAGAMLRENVPDITVVVTPTKFMKDAVIASAQAGVQGVSTDKPIAARLADADEMVETCKRRNVIFAGGNLQRAMWQVQQAAQRLREGRYGRVSGAALHGFSGEISGGGCQHISVLRLFSGAEISEVTAWGSPPESLAREDDQGLAINGRFRLTNGLDCLVFADRTGRDGVEVWSQDYKVHWNWNPPRVYRSTRPNGPREEINPGYAPFPWRHILDKPPLRAGDGYLVSTIRSFVDAVHTRKASLFVSGHDLRQALEAAIACKVSANLGNQPVTLPLKDRSLTLFPSKYRWLGGDASGRPQSVIEAAGDPR